MLPVPQIAVEELTLAVEQAINELNATQLTTRKDSVREQLKFVGEHILRAAKVGLTPAADGVLENQGSAPGANATLASGSSRRVTHLSPSAETRNLMSNAPTVSPKHSTSGGDEWTATHSSPVIPHVSQVELKELELVFTDAVNALVTTTQAIGVREQLKFVGEHILHAATASSAPTADAVLEVSSSVPAAGVSPAASSCEPNTDPGQSAQAKNLSAATPAASTTQRSTSGSDEWTLDGFLASLPGVIAALSSAVLKAPEAAGKTELEFIRYLGNAADGHATLLALLTRGGALAAVSEAIWAGVQTLMEAKAATGLELQAKFLDDGAGTLSYAGLSTFFGGLEARIGGPDPKVHEAMEREHVAEGGDRHDEFRTSNYGVTTTSAIEWDFVAAPDKKPEGGWPIEEKLRDALALDSTEASDESTASLVKRPSLVKLRESGAKMREPMPLATMQKLVEEHNTRLNEQEEPALTTEEAIGARLYTGPLFVKYNGVLRGIDTDVPFLKNSMIQLCCPKAVADAYMGDAKSDEEAKGTLSYAEAKKQLNTYKTTLHAINSAIVKLGKLTVATTVYRGLSGFALPEQFTKSNEYGVRGGVEGAFMSTTLDRKVAMSYAAKDDKPGFVFQIQQGMVDRGADIGWLSQYPHEAEILFAPLTGLEVLSMHVEGAVLVVVVKPSVNLASLTIEEVIGKRKKLLEDMLVGIEADARMMMASEGRISSDGVDFLMESLRKRARTGPLSHDASWYNVDAQLESGLNELLKVGRGLAPGGVERAEALSSVDMAARENYGFVASAYADNIVKALHGLEDSNGGVRSAAVATLGKLSPEALAEHAAAVVGKLEEIGRASCRERV